MAWKSLLLLSWLCVLLPCVAASDLVVRNLPGKTSDETVHEVRRRLANRVKRAGTNVLFDNSTSFSLSLEDVTIFKYPFFNDSPNDKGISTSVKIVCTKCYFTGQASARLTANGPANGSFNISKAVDQAKESFDNTWHNLTEYAQDFADKLLDDFDITDIGDFVDDIKDIDPPPIELNLDLNFPEYNVAVNLTDVEIYMEIDTILSAGITYTFNIYQSKTIVGVALGDDLLLGAVFSIDLIFSVDGQLDIRSGFHVHFDNILTQIVLFGKEASKLDFDGGKIAFLPVTIQYGQVVLKAVLRIEARIGIAFETFIDGIDIPFDSLGPLKVGAGVEARVYANVAEFVTNITLGEVDPFNKRADDEDDEDDCQLKIVQGFTFGIGAAAGATVQILGATWGPSPETEIPIFYTTLAATCITSKSSPPTSTATTTTAAASRSSSAPDKRAESHSVTSTVTTETQVATACISPGLINCPASLQNVTRNVVTRTLTSTITPGVPVAWSTGPVSTFNKVDFKDDAVTMTSSSGKPKSYTPPPPPPPPPTSTASSPASATDEPSTQGNSGKHRVSNAVIIGVSVGLGVPVLLAAIGAFFYFFRRHRRTLSTLAPAETATMSKAQPVVATYAPVRPEDD